MTEDEAKTKWCPHVAISLITALNAAATAGDEKACKRMQQDNQNCIASSCMMWTTYLSTGESGTHLHGKCGLTK